MIKSYRNQYKRITEMNTYCFRTRRVRIIGIIMILAYALFPIALLAQEAPKVETVVPPPPTLEETRLKMEKWIETQQIISKERKDWQQGKEILAGRLDPIRKELTDLKERTQEAETGVAEAKKKKDELIAENDKMKATAEQITDSVKKIEADVRLLYPQLPEPIQARITPLYQRIPEDASKTNVSVAERIQNILGILNETNKANSEITVSYEIRNLADGKPTEVRVFYVGLGQAYYVSASGEAGIGRPSRDGWKWETSREIAHNVLTALEILQGKQSPTFIPMPVKIQ